MTLHWGNGMSTSTSSWQRNRRKILAIASVGLVVGIGAVATLAAWNDNEWVVGGTSGAAGIGTSNFNVEQNRTQSPLTGSVWDDHSTEPDSGALVFSLGALSLTPGDSTYAPVALRTDATSVAGDITVQAPVKSSTVTTNDSSSILWNALQYSVAVTSAPTDCTATTWATFGTPVITDANVTDVLTGTTSQHLLAQSGSIQYYCFKVTLPATPTGVTDLTTLQGLTAAPAWRFAATSTTN